MTKRFVFLLAFALAFCINEETFQVWAANSNASLSTAAPRGGISTTQDSTPSDQSLRTDCPARNPFPGSVPVGLSSKTAKDDAAPCPPTKFETVATGLLNPRGLEFGPDGHLYVSEAGTGGTHSVACVPSPPSIFDPYMSDYTGRIVRIGPGGQKTVVADHLPSTLDNTNTPLGVTDVAFVGDTLYALVFAGCPRFFENVPSSVIRINPNGSWSIVADLSAYFRSHPVLQPPAAAPDGDFEPDGSPYTMIALGHDLYVAEANSGQLLRVTTNGHITRIIDLSVNHPVPTALTYHAGNFYLTTFGSATTDGAAVYEINPRGRKRMLISGLNPLVGIAFHDDKLYVLETFSGEPYSAGTGRLLRLSHSGEIEQVRIIACGLTFPTAMTVGPDGALYISNVGYGVDPRAGLGEVIRIPLED